MVTENQRTREEEAYYRLLEEMKSELSKSAYIVIGDAQSTAYAMHMVRSYCLQPFEYDEAMERMRLAATQLTGRESELLATLWRAGLAAAASIDPEDTTLVGHNVDRGDLYYYYRMWSGMVEEILEEKKVAESLQRFK